MLLKLFWLMIVFASLLACSNSVMPKDTVSGYLEEIQAENHDNALSYWEMVSVGMIDDSLTKEGKSSRIDARLAIEQELYRVLKDIPEGFSWIFDKSMYYKQSESGYTETDQVRNAKLATVLVTIAIHSPNEVGTAADIGFNLLMTNNSEWKIVGLDVSQNKLLTIVK